MIEHLPRREFLRTGIGLVGAGLASGLATPAFASLGGSDCKELAFLNLHTGERLKAEFWAKGSYLPDALSAVNHVLRDHRNGAVHAIEPKLLDLLALLQQRLGSTAEIQVISGYRSPESNAKMHAHSSGVASHSLHMEGKAIDLRLADVPLATLHRTALAMRAGGVGYYPSPDFVHVDVGRVRHWGG